MSVLRYWAAGMVFIIAAWISIFPLLFLQGFFESLAIVYADFARPLVYSLVYVIVLPYIFGRIVSWVAQKILKLT